MRFKKNRRKKQKALVKGGEGLGEGRGRWIVQVRIPMIEGPGACSSLRALVSEAEAAACRRCHSPGCHLGMKLSAKALQATPLQTLNRSPLPREADDRKYHLG